MSYLDILEIGRSIVMIAAVATGTVGGFIGAAALLFKTERRFFE